MSVGQKKFFVSYLVCKRVYIVKRERGREGGREGDREEEEERET